MILLMLTIVSFLNRQNADVDICHLLCNYSTCLDVCQPNISLATSFQQGLGDNVNSFVDIWHFLCNYSLCLLSANPIYSLQLRFRKVWGWGIMQYFFVDLHCIQF